MLTVSEERIQWRKDLVEKLMLSGKSIASIDMEMKEAERLIFGDQEACITFYCKEKDYREVMTILEDFSKKNGHIALSVKD